MAPKRIYTDEELAASKKTSAASSLGSRIWEEYEYAVFSRHGVSPIRNAKTNRQCVEIGKRLGKDAPAIAAFYVTVNDPSWARMFHPIGMLLVNAETVAILWQKNQMNRPSVQSMEKTVHKASQIERIKKGEL